MLKPAIDYIDQLMAKNGELMYSNKYMYLYGSANRDGTYFTSDEVVKWGESFVTVNSEDNITGFVTFDIDWQTMCCYVTALINFMDTPNAMLIKDVFDYADDMFKNRNIQRIQFTAFEDNPFTKSYRKIINEHGGTECGHSHRCAKLRDGKLHDSLTFEILVENYHKEPIKKKSKDVIA